MKHLIGYLAPALSAALLVAAARPAPAVDAATQSQVAQADVYVDRSADTDGTAAPGHTRGAPDGSPCNTVSVAANANPFAGRGATGCSNPYLRNADDADSGGPYHTWNGYRAE
jgi:hypothetical protein